MDSEEKDHILRQMKHKIKKMIEAREEDSKIKKLQRKTRKLRDGE